MSNDSKAENKDIPEIGNQAKRPAMVTAALVHMDLMQEVVDLLRDQPIPHKLSNPLIMRLQKCQIGEFPIGAAD